MKYPVFCECGKEYAVTSAMAGSKLPCACSRTIEIPQFSILRASVGYSATPADYQLFRMIQEGKLPGELCIVCNEPTGNIRHLHVIGKITYPDIPTEFPGLESLTLLAKIMVYFGQKERRASPDIVRHFDIPLRICRECDLDILNEKLLRNAVAREPMYAALLSRYPDSTFEDVT